MLKVLHVIPSISTIRGGPSTAVIAMVKALRDQEVDARILTTNDDGVGLNKDFPIGSWFMHEEVPVLAFSRWSPQLQFLREFAVTPSLTAWLVRHIHEYQLLHIHAIFSYPSTSAMFVARHRNVPYVVRCIGQLSCWSLSQSSLRKRWMLRIVERKNLNGAAVLHYTSKLESDEAKQLGLSPKNLILPLGVHSYHSPEAVNKSIDSKRVRFLVLCRIHPKKQLGNLIQALALLKVKRPDASWELRIAGNGSPSYVEALQAQILQLGLASNVCWLGFLKGEEKWRELRRASWFILPSASENFGIAVVEALSTGTPVILSPQVAVATEVKSYGAGLVGDCSPSNLELLLEQALDSRRHVEMGLAAVKLAQTNFSWPTITEILIKTYRQLIQSGLTDQTSLP